MAVQIARGPMERAIYAREGKSESTGPGRRNYRSSDAKGVEGTSADWTRHDVTSHCGVFQIKR